MVDPGEYTVQISIGSDKASGKFMVEEDPRITWFSAADRAKRRAALNELVEMSKAADGLRRKFTAADAALTALNKKIPEDAKPQAESLKKSLDGVRPLFATRNFFDGPNAEDRKAELLKPEPDFVLPALMQRVSQQINGLEGFSAAPSESQLKQIAIVKAAIADASKQMEGVRAEVVKFNEAMTAAKVPYVPVP